MRHKHKRRQKVSSTYDLPPSVIAKSLPTLDPKAKQPGKKKTKKESEKAKAAGKFETKPKSGTISDDTPKAFRRLMQYQEKRGTTAGTGTGQDGESRKRKRDADGKEEGSGKKEKKDARAAAAATEIEKDAERKGLDAPKILPGEKLSDFAARVDRELPLSAMKKSIRPAGSDVPDIREQRLTKHDKRLKQLQRQWREEEERIREREEEERDEREAGMEDQTELWRQWETEAGKKKKRKGSAAAKRKTGGNDSDSADDPDPWAKLNNRDRLNKPVNPFDVAQAPPQLNKAKGKFKVSGGARVDVANVPAAVGSLRRREELAGERRNIVEEYRRLMAEKRK